MASLVKQAVVEAMAAMIVALNDEGAFSSHLTDEVAERVNTQVQCALASWERPPMAGPSTAARARGSVAAALQGPKGRLPS